MFNNGVLEDLALSLGNFLSLNLLLTLFGPLGPLGLELATLLLKVLESMLVLLKEIEMSNSEQDKNSNQWAVVVSSVGSSMLSSSLVMFSLSEVELWHDEWLWGRGGTFFLLLWGFERVLVLSMVLSFTLHVVLSLTSHVMLW